MHGWIQLAQEFKYALRSLSRAKGLSLDRKSTRLNSSHLVISYAVFCLKKYLARPARVEPGSPLRFRHGHPTPRHPSPPALAPPRDDRILTTPLLHTACIAVSDTTMYSR